MDQNPSLIEDHKIYDFVEVLENFTKKIIQFCGMGIWSLPVLLGDQMPAPQEILDISLIGSLLNPLIHLPVIQNSE